MCLFGVMHVCKIVHQIAYVFQNIYMFVITPAFDTTNQITYLFSIARLFDIVSVHLITAYFWLRVCFTS